MDWLRNMRIVLRAEKIAYVLDAPLPVSPSADASIEDQIAYQKNLDDSIIVVCIMLASMSPRLQKQHEAMIAYDIVAHLKELFHDQARSETFEVSKMLFRSRMQEGTSPIQYALKMHGYIVRLDQLGFGMDNELSIDLILAGLPDSFAQFVLNYRMNDKETTIPELINLLKTVEPTLVKEGKTMMLVNSSSSKIGSKNNKKRKITKQKGGGAGAQRKRSKRHPRKVHASIVVKKAIGRQIARRTWSQRRRLHVMHQHLQVFMSLNLILFLMATFRY